MYKRWTPEEDAKLRELFMQHTRKEVAAIMGTRNEKAIHARCHILKLKKGSNSGQFKKGHSPFNKGKAMASYLPPETLARVLQGQFVKGRKTWNHKEVGSMRIDRKDGYLIIKTGEPKTWQHLHRVIYEQAYGHIPPDHHIRFKDGNTLNVAIENLYMVDKAENMLANSVRNLPPELFEIVQIKKRINNLIKKRNGTKQN